MLIKTRSNINKRSIFLSNIERKNKTILPEIQFEAFLIMIRDQYNMTTKEFCKQYNIKAKDLRLMFFGLHENEKVKEVIRLMTGMLIHS